MRANLTSLVLFLISIFTFTSARPRSLNSYSHSNNAIARRQFHTPRALLDTCANVDLGLLLPHVGDVSGNVCLCLSLFPLDLDLYADLDSILNILGPLDLDARLKLEVGKSGHQCTYPEHGRQKCSSSNPCDFDCEDGYTKDGGQCRCKAPYTECNGKCSSFPHGCSSSVPRSLQDHAFVALTADLTVNGLRKAQFKCKSKHVCGVNFEPNGYECIDINRNTESCGGCVTPHPFGGSDQSLGRDCWTIANASDVSCVSGRCVVRKCANGSQISTGGDSCV